MVREIVLKAWCDFHMGADDPVEATETHKVSLDGKSYTLDLCAECDTERFAPLAELVAKHSAREGSDPKPPPPGDKPKPKSKLPGYTPPSHVPGMERPCFLCAFVAKDRSTFDRHMEGEHSTTPSGAFGLECPLCGQAFSRPQGLGVHSGRAHGDLGVSTVPQLFMYASTHGDPLGVVTKRRAMFAVIERPAELFGNHLA